MLGADAAVLSGVGRLLAPGATATVLLSVVPRDGVAPVPAPEALAAAYARAGMRLGRVRPATAAEVAATRSSWARRLRAGTARPVTLLRFQARPEGAGD
jgi:16S rRNA (adenine(1408)-N(1))-methyltransferase